MGSKNVEQKVYVFVFLILQ